MTQDSSSSLWEAQGWSYSELRRLVQDEALPAMIVDLAIFDANVARIADVVRPTGKTIRLASKSVRVPALIQRIFDVGGAIFRGIMCFSVAEAQFLVEQGFDDLLIAYPTVQPADLALACAMTRSGTRVTLMLDCIGHVEKVEAFWEAQAEEAAPLRVCIDADMSYRPAGLHLGVQRSPVRDLASFRSLARRIQASSSLRLAGVMGYEAQVAGLGETNPFSPWMNPVKGLLKRMSVRDVARKREAIAQFLEEEGVALELFNGGGTGSVHLTSQERWLTEVTAGSGFLQPHLFDYYKSNRNPPAFCFGLPVTRTPQEGIVTCQSGGFIASGEIHPDKAPVPFLPQGLEPISTEGFGEVQTPLRTPRGMELSIGDPVFFRPAKAGEVAERFHDYLLKEGDAIVGRAQTYRGYGKCFF